MQGGQSVVGAAALLEFLATATRTRIVATDLRPATNYRRNLLPPSEAKLILDEAIRLPDTLVFPVGVHSPERGFDFVHPLLRIPEFIGEVNTLVGTQTQEGCEPGRLANG